MLEAEDVLGRKEGHPGMASEVSSSSQEIGPNSLGQISELIVGRWNQVGQKRDELRPEQSQERRRNTLDHRHERPDVLVQVPVHEQVTDIRATP